jgi:hypothetical protein
MLSRHGGDGIPAKMPFLGEVLRTQNSLAFLGFVNLGSAF